MERRPEPSDSPRSEPVVDPRTNLAVWLRAGRAHRGMSLDDVAKVTKIQPRILERLEAGKFDGLPAEVFVRGFVRSFARCVGLDEREALRRYAACALGSQDLTPTVRALVEVMADLAPGSASAARATPRKMQAVEVIDLVGPVVLAPAEPEPASVEPELASGEAPSDVAPVGPVATAVEAPALQEPAIPMTEPTLAAAIAPTAEPPIAAAPSSPPAAVAAPDPAVPVASGSKKKRDRRRKARAAAQEAAAAARQAAEVSPGPVERAAEPPRPASAPWHRLARRASVAPAAPLRPSLVIDDADPESAERLQEERAERAESAGTAAPRRSFLPPILLDHEDRSARQGGLTLAVILLLIAATLTLSYLMRRPSASGDGVTGREAPSLRADRGRAR